MATVHLMVGLPCSGKTTLARTLEQTCAALRLTPDEWQARLFGNDVHDPAHDARHTQIEALLWEVAQRALVLGINVILDFGFWSRDEREAYRARAHALGARSELHVLAVSEEVLFRRLAQRNAHPSAGDVVIPDAMLREWIALFQAPTPDECRARDGDNHGIEG